MERQVRHNLCRECKNDTGSKLCKHPERCALDIVNRFNKKKRASIVHIEDENNAIFICKGTDF